MEVIFAPEASRAEVAAIYPGGRIEPLPDSLNRLARPLEVSELRELVALILPDADDIERAEVLRVAEADPEAALTSFRALAADLQPQPPTDADDRRTCRQCNSLSPDGRCRAAGRGELPNIHNRRYEPVRNVPQRCVGYLPRPDDPDQRPGAERWPSLSEGALAPERGRR